MFKGFVCFFILLFLPFFMVSEVVPFVFAHGTDYLEFNPDYFKTKPLVVSTAGVMYEIFLPSNEFLGGVDFWFDNAGSSGTATFELRDENNNFITSKSVTIPHIDVVSGGQRIHVDWNSQIPVTSNDKYKIRISSNLPQLQIYYSSRINFLGHNEPHLSDYLSGAAEVGGEEKEFSFKYALYETTETSVPVISNVGWVVISESQMRLDFNANEPVDFMIEYGISGQGYTQSTNWTGEYQFCAEGVATCNAYILVSPGTTYEYRLTAKDSWGNQSQSTGTFESGQGQTPTPSPSTSSGPTPSASATPTPSGSPTPTPTGTTPPPPPAGGPSPTPDTSPLSISNLRIVTLTDKSVEVAWTTNKTANSHLLISTPFYITITDASDPTMELEHFLTSPNVLGPNTLYIGTVTSIDSSNNESQASISFTTLPSATPTGSPPPAGGPQPSSSPDSTGSPQVNTITTSSSGSGGSVTWSSSPGGEPSDGYRVDIFDKNGNFIKTIYVPAGSNSADIPDLNEGEYSVIVYTNNDGVFKKLDQPAQLKVDPPFIKRLLVFWWALIPLLAGLGYVLWRNYGKKSKFDPLTPTN